MKLDRILNHFKKNDLILYSYFLKIGKLEPIKKEKPRNYFSKLCREIIGQQLSDASSSAILSRFQKLFPRGRVNPVAVLGLTHDQLRATGMSNAKARYVRNLAQDIVSRKVLIDKLETFSDEEVIVELIKVKGIGRWTAEMFLMFTLGRDDVFSFGDLGLKKGLMKVYKLKKEPTEKHVQKIISKWSPYKTYAARVLWGCLEL